MFRVASIQGIINEHFDEECFKIAEFYSPDVFRGASRCDLHPRWNRTGTQICVDSVQKGCRQMYIVDVSELAGVP